MKILIIGFQRSGTTLMRRIIQSHPEVKRIYHEQFLLRRHKTKASLFKAIRNSGLDPINDNWGEKTPFYPTIRRISVLKYCDIWNEYFGDESRILHIIRHPIDVAFSVLNKTKGGTIDGPLNMYSRIMPIHIPTLNKRDDVFTFKYEDVLMNPDDILPKIFEFCGLKADVNFRKYLKKYKNKRYQTLDGSRAFAYKQKIITIKQDLSKAIKISNIITGPKYEVLK